MRSQSVVYSVGVSKVEKMQLLQLGPQACWTFPALPNRCAGRWEDFIAVLGV